MNKVLLCVDAQSCKNPSLIGLEDVSFESCPWLVCEHTAQECRVAARDEGVGEIWVVSCDDMESINVAAAIKQDNATKPVYLLSAGANGSLASRASNAHIDAVWSESALARCYAQRKSAAMQGCGSVAGGGVSGNAAAAFPRVPASAPMPDLAGQTSVLPPVGERGIAAGNPAVPALQVTPQGQKGEMALALRSVRRASLQDGTVIAVVSGSGGCGKSTLAALFALIAAQAEADMTVAVIDADLQFGDMDQLLGAKDAVHIEDAMEDPAMLQRLKDTARSGAPALLCAPRRLEASEAVANFLGQAIDVLRAQFDVVVVNTGSFWSETHAVVLDAADAVAFVVDQRPSSLRATVHAVELCSRLGVATSGFIFAVNKHEKTSLLSAMDVSCALRGAHAVELPYGGREVDELLGAGYAQELLDSKNAFVAATRELLLRLLPAERRDAVMRASQGHKRKKGLFGRGGSS